MALSPEIRHVLESNNWKHTKDEGIHPVTVPGGRHHAYYLVSGHKRFRPTECYILAVTEKDSRLHVIGYHECLERLSTKKPIELGTSTEVKAEHGEKDLLAYLKWYHKEHGKCDKTSRRWM